MITNQVSTKSIELIVLLSVLALSVIIYMPGLDGPLLLDDYPRLGAFFEGDALGQDELSSQLANNPATLKRPVSMLTFVGNYLLNEGDLFAWKLTNLLIHLTCGMIWFAFLKIVEKVLRIRSGIDYRYLALAVATVWLLHPLQVSTTLYLVQRMAQLSALFIALGLTSYALGRLQQIRGQSGKVYLYLSILVFLPLAVFSKENGVILPLLILVTELILFRFAASPLQKDELKWFLVIAVIMPIIAGIAILISYFDTLVIQGYQGRPFTLGERMLTEFRVICMYLGQILWPAPSSLKFFYETIPASDFLFRPIATALSLTTILVLLAVAWISRHKMPLLAFGLVFYFVSISVESSIFALEFAFEHRNYIGILGIAIAMYSIATKLIPRSVIKYISYVFLIGILSLTTASRAATWSSQTSLYNYYYSINPESPRVVSKLAEELTKQAQYDHALRLLAGVNANGARLQSFYIQCLRGDNLQDVDYMRMADKIKSPIDNYALTGIIEIANLGLDKQCNLNHEGYELFLSEISSREYRSASEVFKIKMYHAHYLWETGKNQEAFALLESIATGDYASPVPLYLAADWSLDIGDRKSAISYLKQAEDVARAQSQDYTSFRNGIKKRLANSDENGS